MNLFVVTKFDVDQTVTAAPVGAYSSLEAAEGSLPAGFVEAEHAAQGLVWLDEVFADDAYDAPTFYTVTKVEAR